MSISFAKRMSDFLIPPRIPFQGNRDMDTIQHHRKICWIICILSALCTLTTWVLFAGKFVQPSKNPFIAIGTLLAYTLISRAVLFSIGYFSELKNVFFSLRLKEISERLVRAEGKGGAYTVRMRSFLFYPDLEELEDILRNRFLRQIKRARTEKQHQKNVRDQERLRQTHEAIDREVLEAADRLGKSYKVRRALRRDLSLSRKRGLLTELVRFATMGSGTLARPSQEEAKLNRLVGILADIADGELCQEAKILHERAKQAIAFKEKERLLSSAIETQRAHKRAETGAPECKESDTPREVLPAQYVRLWEYARNSFSIREILPSEVDEEMAKAILLVLIDPGSRERVFQNKYRPADRLKKDVARYYGRIGIPFRPECFERTLSRLHAEGILFSKPKRDERTYSLTSKPSAGKSARAQSIIRKVNETVSLLKQ